MADKIFTYGNDNGTYGVGIWLEKVRPTKIFAYGEPTDKTAGYSDSIWYTPTVIREAEGYTAAQVMEALRASTRTVWFEWWLLNANNARLRKINIINAQITCDENAAINRSMAGSIRAEDAAGINWGMHRLQPFFCMRMPDGGTYEDPMGIFIPATPQKNTKINSRIIDVEGYDLLLILSEDRLLRTTTFAAGESYMGAVQTIIQQAGIQKIMMDPGDETLNSDLTFEIGTDRLTAVNALLTAAGYARVYVDRYGTMHCKKYIMPYDRGIAHAYVADGESVILPEISEANDLFQIPNVFVASVSIPDGKPLVSVYVNDNPMSKTSTVARGRKIVKTYAPDNVANQEVLDMYVRIRAMEAEATYCTVGFETLAMPGHEIGDVLHVAHPRGEVEGRFVETRWTLDMTSKIMTHTAERVVLV